MVLSNLLSRTYKNFRKLLILSGFHLRVRKLPAEKWVFISRRLKYRVGGQNKEIMIFSELLDNAIKKIFYPLKL